MEGVAYTSRIASSCMAAGAGALHRDHHEPHDHHLERNDLYAVFFAIIVTALFVAGSWIWPLTPIAIGATL